jgi:1-acyl-sn-glycerol-3-phosphate acyltransferase
MMLLFSKLLFRLGGWTYEEHPDIWEDKQVAVGFPHTTNLDGFRTLAMFKIYGIKVNTLMKKDLFIGPFGWILKAVGAIPIDRSNQGNVVEQMRLAFAERDKFTLLIAPEGTRNTGKGNRKPIRTGFWHIAKAAKVPIILMFSDARQKRGRILAKFVPGESLKDDLRAIQKVYAQEGIHIVVE